MKLLLFDLDGTLLRSDKTISERTIKALGKCREQGILIGISTSRAEHNCIAFLSDLNPDVFIASGGAVVKYRDNYIYAIQKVCKFCGIDLKDVTAFGDDAPDIGMLKLCGTGVAMGNAIDCVKEVADIVIGSNDDDGIAEYLTEEILAYAEIQ